MSEHQTKTLREALMYAHSEWLRTKSPQTLDAPDDGTHVDFETVRKLWKHLGLTPS